MGFRLTSAEIMKTFDEIENRMKYLDLQVLYSNELDVYALYNRHFKTIEWSWPDLHRANLMKSYMGFPKEDPFYCFKWEVVCQL